MKRALPDFTKYSDLFDQNNLKQFKDGEYIFHKGEKADCMFIVLSGRVEIISEKIVISTVEKGGIFGDMALIDQSPRSADVRALSDCTLASFDDYAFRFLVRRMPDFTLDIMRVMADRLRIATASLPQP